MKDFAGKTAVITGAGSGFGREFARTAAGLGMKLVLADIQADALAATAAEFPNAEVLALRTDVAKAADMERLADEAYARFGQVHLLFNNAGVGAGGLVWENTVADWDWVLGVNLWSVIHGIRLFTPRMLAGGEACHIVNTASVAGLLSAPLMGVYNVSKHAVVTLSETLYHDLRLAQAPIGVTVLCPAFVPTGIAHAARNRPEDLRNNAAPTPSQLAAQAASEKAVSSGRLTAADVAAKTFDCIRDDRFYCFTHGKILASVELRLQDILQARDPTDPFSYKPSASPAL
jgi:NAD(P)-dependent dehydrogenase (short-subunit alcohol dehydrogenase family)